MYRHRSDFLRPDGDRDRRDLVMKSVRSPGKVSREKGGRSILSYFDSYYFRIYCEKGPYECKIMSCSEFDFLLF